ncbi:MAG: AMP-binding protein [Saprospiraceae bacterium]|nr:AMP-binding protein [Saprospiraceae bacterium]
MSENRPWLKIYPKGIPANIDPEQYCSIIEYFEEICQKYKSKPAFSCMGKEITYKELDQKATQFGAYLQSRGLEHGDRVAIMMPNLLQYPIATFGALKAGLVIVNTNPLYTPREMEHQFKDSGVKAIVIAENFAANLQKVINNTDIKTIITTSIGEMLGMFKGTLVNFVVKNVKKMVPSYDLPNTVKFSQALKVGKKFTINPAVETPDRVIVHQYTGGTTGVSKGAMLTNRNLVANMMQLKAWLEPYLKEGEIVLAPLPLYHIFAFAINCLAMMNMGALNILVTNPRNLSTIIKEFKRYKITLVTGVNTLYIAMINNKEFQELDFSNLKAAVGGGMAVQRSVAEKWKELTGCTLTEGYGMTEASPVVSVNPLDDSGRIGTIGIPVPSTDVRIIDEQGNILGPNQVGEIQVSGPQVMKGYYNKPEETENTIKDGWLCTGDIGLMEEDGFFRIVDRKKDMILVSGFNVFPNEIEDVVAMHPKVLEVAAIGIPNEKSGEVVKIFIVKKDKSLKEEEIIQHCRENLTGYKVPKAVEFRKDLPKTNVGKILRRKLKEEK